MIKPSVPSQSEESLRCHSYGTHARPLVADLLKGAELDLKYTDGQGHWLMTEINGQKRLILDMVGGYGANLLGHKPQFLIEKAIENLKSTPQLTQASHREEAGKLAQKISDLLFEETGEGPWITTFSNTGTEAIEAALKHSLLSYRYRQHERQLEFQKQFNESLLEIEQLSLEQRSDIFFQLKRNLSLLSAGLKAHSSRKDWLLHRIINSAHLKDLLQTIHEFNTAQLSERPCMMALEKAYHGKTMGSLSLTHNPRYREEFYVEYDSNTVFIKPEIDHDLLKKKFENELFDVIDWQLVDQQFFLSTVSLSRIAGFILEPIQGEAGVYEVPHLFLTLLKKFSLHYGFLVIFDDVQSGLYRTGTLSAASHAHVTADIYCFSKALGGGLAKIGATSIHHKKYLPDFGLLHTSTFSEDSYSSHVAFHVLDFLTTEKELMTTAMIQGARLKASLSELQEEFPHLIKEVRGRGLMLALELSSELIEQFFELQILNQSKMLGFVIASYLLHTHSIRVSPTLSSGQTLRLQPSLYLTSHDVSLLSESFRTLCLELNSHGFSRIFKSLYPQHEIAPVISKKLSPLIRRSDKPLAVFLCHIIDGEHAKLTTPSLIDVPSDVIEKRLQYLSHLSEFGVLHGQSLKGMNGQDIDIALIGIPVTSAQLKKQYLSKHRHLLVEKVQSALVEAKNLGAHVVGLGQFTSIVTNNGLYLDPMGMSLTTGNSYTVCLAVEAAYKAAEAKNIKLSETTMAIIGCAGNIMSIAASLVADKIEKLILVHHSELRDSQKFVAAVKTILENIFHTEADSPFRQKLKKHFHPDLLQSDEALVEWLLQSHIQEFFVLTADLSQIKNAQVVLTGASSHKGFLTHKDFAQDAVVVDIAVPANITPEELIELKRERPDLTYLMGGIAQFPLEQSLNADFFPLRTGESFACMAETFALGLTSSDKQFLHIGPLNKKMVLQAQTMANKAGFKLGRFKSKASL
jgi:acetylornithine/succinyldiaminopimelate/putrescine aminotransferase/predicted amino acid dehydrogenase